MINCFNFLGLIYRKGNCAPERVSDLSNVTQPGTPLKYSFFPHYYSVKEREKEMEFQAEAVRIPGKY